MKNCNCHTDIIRDGSGQLQRFLKALDPAYAPIDGRSREDLLVFAKKYAAQIRFYDIPESSLNGSDPKKLSWREFFRRDMAVVIASVAVTDLAAFKKEFDQVRDQVELNPAPDTFAALFGPILGMLKKIDHWYTVAIPENPLYTDLVLAINSDLRWQAKNIMAYKREFNVVDPNSTLDLDLNGIENESLWGMSQPFELESVLYQGDTKEEKIQFAALSVEDIFYAFYNVIAKLIDGSGKYLDFALEQFPAHQPHMALFIAFLELFRLAQDQLNGLTEKMLDFYYREVLQLKVKPSIPDKAHIVFELAKDVTDYDLVQGTALKAGNDQSGKEQIYRTRKELVINQAKVQQLSTIFIEKKEDGDKEIVNIHARPVANSKDGFGEKFTTPYPKWPTFGKGNPAAARPENICDKLALIDAPPVINDQARLGIAFASPQLLLQGGKRLIQLMMRENISGTRDSSGQKLLMDQLIKALTGIEIWFTGEKGWIKIGGNQNSLSNAQKEFIEILKRLEGNIFPAGDEPDSFYFIEDDQILTIYLPLTEQPVVGFDPKLHPGYNFEAGTPVMLLLNRRGEQLNIPEAVYTGLRRRLFGIRTKVGSIVPDEFTPEMLEVIKKNADQFVNFQFDGLKKLVLQNDERVLPEGSAFDPFTALPEAGKSFYIGSDEVFNKTQNKLAVFIRRTEDVKTTKSLSKLRSIAAGFKAMERLGDEYSVSVLSRRNWIPLCDAAGLDFNRLDLMKNILRKPVINDGVPQPQLFSVDRKPLLPVTEWKEGVEKGFLRLENLVEVPGEGNEGHTQASQDMAHELEIKEISVSYDSMVIFDYQIDRVYHVYPFGIAEIEAKEITRLAGAAKVPKKYPAIDPDGKLLPQFTHINWMADAAGIMQVRRFKKEEDLLKAVAEKKSTQYSGNLQQEGMLMIGLENGKPLQNVSLLFQFAEGSAEDEDGTPPTINWSYLVYNAWQPLDPGNLVSDGTYGFQTTGIIDIAIPEDATTRHDIMTEGLIWLCASVGEHSDRIPMLVDVVTQAVEAEFFDQQNDPSHFDKALPAGSITELQTAVPEIGKLTQPFASFDGKHQEIGREFYTRVSERLRHKQRAITAWDYEHLVLDRFPSIYKVKCINYTDPDCLCREPVEKPKNGVDAEVICCGPQVAPGHVLLVPIANLKNRNAINPLQPKTARRTLLEIESWLKKYTSPFVKVHARNPQYEQILVSFSVKFYSGTDAGFYLKKLNDEIVHFLTPWAFDENATVVFGQKIYASSIINFIEERSYVDFITDFMMMVCRRPCCKPAGSVIKVTVELGKPTGGERGIAGKITTAKGPLAGVVVVFGDGRATTDANGDFLVQFLRLTDLTISFTPDGYETETVTLEATNEVPSLTLSLEFYKKEVVPEPVNGISKEDLEQLCGCSDIEYLLQDDLDFPGAIVARPSTARSILVSAPRHLINLYKEPPPLSPCEKKALLPVPPTPQPPVETVPNTDIPENDAVPSPQPADEPAPDTKEEQPDGRVEPSKKKATGRPKKKNK